MICFYFFLLKAAEQYKARLKGSLALMGEKKAKLSLSQDEIKQKLANCKEQKDSLQQEILEQADVLVKGIKQVGIFFVLLAHSPLRC